MNFIFIWDFVAANIMDELVNWFYGQLIGALFAVSLVVTCFEFGLEYTTGRANLRQTALNILKGFLAVSLFSTVPVQLYELSVSLQAAFTGGIAGLGTSIGDVGRGIIDDIEAQGGLEALADGSVHLGIVHTSPIMILFCIIFMAYAVIKVFFSNLKRGGILLIQIAIGRAGSSAAPGRTGRGSPEHLPPPSDRGGGAPNRPQRRQPQPHGVQQHQ